MPLSEFDVLLTDYQDAQAQEKYTYAQAGSPVEHRMLASERVNALARQIANVLASGKAYV